MKNTLLFVSIIIGSFLHGQSVKLDRCKKIEILSTDKDSTRIYSFSEFPGISLITHIRLKEYFVADDTIHRDFMKLDKKEIVIDSILGLLQPDYTISYDLTNVYFFEKAGNSFIIFEGTDVFPLGTDQQVYYFILKKQNNDWEYVHSYENEHAMSTSNIKVINRKNKIFLKGKHINQIKRISPL